jgi:hypothetical protein
VFKKRIERLEREREVVVEDMEAVHRGRSSRILSDASATLPPPSPSPSSRRRSLSSLREKVNRLTLPNSFHPGSYFYNTHSYLREKGSKNSKCYS